MAGGPSHRIARVVLPLAAALAGAGAGCGGDARRAATETRAHHPAVPIAQSVCGRAARALQGRLAQHVQVRIADRDPGYLECLLSGGGIRLDVVAQAIPQARTAYETAIVHFVQTYVEPEGLHHRSQLPQNIAGLGTEAAWVPERRMLLVTTASFSRGGNFLNIAVSGRSAAAGEPVAEAVARALVPVLPRGPDPGPPPG